MAAYPLRFEPIYKPRIWGGDAIFRHFNRPRALAEPVGESWELADLEEGQSVIAAGPDRGRTLRELLHRDARTLMGDAPLFDGYFPLLIKFLNAQTALSVQVHPSEAVARELGGSVRVKHESWYVLAAEPEGCIYHGLKPGVTREAFREAMLTGGVEGVLRKVMVQPGCCYHLPSGTPHALGAGVLVAEIQTPSDITYRTYDWGRVDPTTGRPRKLHLEQALRCIDFDNPSPPPMQPPRTIDERTTRVAACEWFTIDRCRAPANAMLPVSAGEPVVRIMLEGSGRITTPAAEPCDWRAGEVILLPALLLGTMKFHEQSAWLKVGIPKRDVSVLAKPQKE